MILKSLTLQGFKSFAQRVTLELSPGVAAVVGPNGSGKSNISDAIRWVLGEQSVKLLRGMRLEDVIFAGSDTKRAVGMAEVSVTFDNASGDIPVDYSEVTVTRRVYRSGESDFLINKNSCRLRDIHELFMDTGVGRGSLALIGQGEVDSILSARSDDRRAFLEEVAGITKYRARKQEALTKLVRAEENLVRVRDIIAEVENRLDPLARQAELAREYEEVNERLEVVEVDLLLDEKGRALEAYEANQREARLMESRRSGAKDRLQMLHVKVQEISKRLDELDDETEACREQVEEAKEKEVSCRYRGDLARERLLRAEREEGERRRRLQGLASRLSRHQEDLRVAQEARVDVEGAIARKEAELKEVETSLSAAGERFLELEERLRDRRRFLAERSERLVSSRSRVEALKKEIDHRSEQGGDVQSRLDKLRREEKEALAQRESEQRRLQSVSQEYEAARQAVQEVDGHLTEARTMREEVETELSEERRRLQDLLARRQALADMEASREGYHRGVRTVLKVAPSKGWQLKGAVAELLHLPERLETAVEVALGSAQQFVVAERNVDAKAAIDYLKEKRQGRATFLPLESLRPRNLSREVTERIIGVDGVVGVASDLVETAKECRPVAEYLLGRVVITRDLDAALAVARAVRGFSRAVTLDGDVMIPGGAMTGGSRPGRSEGLIARSRQLEDLTEAASQCDERVNGFNRELTELDGKAQALRRRATDAETKRRELEIARLSAERDVKETEIGLKRVRKEAAESETAVERLVKQCRTLEKELAELIAATRAVETERETVAGEVSSLEETLHEGKAQEDGFRRDVEALRVALAGLTRTGEEHSREVDRLQREARDVEEGISQETGLLESLSADRKKARDDIGAAGLELERATADRGRLSARLDELRTERRSLKEESDGLGVKVKEAQALLDEIQEEHARVRVEEERLEIQLAQIEERLVERGGGDVEPNRAESPVDVTALKTEARSLKKRLEMLGPVHAASIEEFEAVKERHAFLTLQKADLEEAQARLREIITRIDHESRGKLDRVFQAVRQAFADVFVRLFGGGKARLEFVDPSDPLESGVDIFVQPPGKKLQNLLALSGGERALAAIALLFAILAVRPSPFCVLDEIDAALDEHNLERFRGLLEEYARATQFLVITHRQPTMETADSLFGVTMEESGVSTLVSLKLDKAKSA